MNKILIVEPNPYHNEVIPGIALYFEKLGYSSNIVIRTEAERDGVFCRCGHHFQVRAMTGSQIKAYLASKDITEFDFLFLSSMEFVQDKKTIRFLDCLDSTPAVKYGILGMYHTVSYIEEFGDMLMLEQNRLFCLSQFQTKDFAVRMLNCHYFGNIRNSEECKTDKRTITVIGIAAEKNYLVEAFTQLSDCMKKKLKIELVGEKKNPCWVRTRRKIKLALLSMFSLINRKYAIRKKSIRQIVEEGYVDFSKMYEIIENSDFILVMINPENPNHRRYLTLGTSGIIQLIYGFEKVCLIRREVAETYGFSSENAILYEKGGLEGALQNAAEMSQQEYKLKKQKIVEMEQRIFAKSLENLKKTIEEIKSMED